MRILSKYKISDNTSTKSSQKQNQWADVLPGVLGLGGQIAGGFGGAATGFGAGAAVPGADLTGVPEVGGAIMGERIGQTAGGSGGQAFGEWLRQMLQGQKTDPGAIASNAGQGALYAQIPGGKMAEGIANPLMRTLAKTGIRFGGGAAVGGGTQAIRNVQNNKPITQGVGGQATLGGAINTVIPGGMDIIKGAAKIPRFIGNKAGAAGQDVLGRDNMATVNAMQKMYGPETIDNVGGYGSIRSQAQDLMNKYNLPKPFGGSIHDVKPALEKASKDVATQLEPLLKSTTVNYSSELKPIIDENAMAHFGSTGVVQRGIRGTTKSTLPPNVDQFVKNARKLGGVSDGTGSVRQISKNPTLLELDKLKTQAANLVKDWNSPKDTTDQFGITMYGKIKDLIQSKLDSSGATQYKDLIAEHKALIGMKDANRKLMSGQIPEEILSQNMAKTQQQSGTLSGERATALALGPLSVLGTQLSPFPKPVKNAATAAELAFFMPRMFPESGQVIQQGLGGVSKGMENIGGNQKLMQALQQLGIRLPGVLDQNK